VPGSGALLRGAVRLGCFVSVIVSEEGEVLNCSALLEIARVLVGLDHLASSIVNANHRMV
jgi:hypothetical protein